jgi:hypothetical protein
LGLRDNLSKSYERHNISPNDLYYDIYHQLTQETQYNVQLEILSSDLIACSRKLRTLPVLTSNTPVIVDFSVPISPKLNQCCSPDQTGLSSQCIQLKLKFEEK